MKLLAEVASIQLQQFSCTVLTDGDCIRTDNDDDKVHCDDRSVASAAGGRGGLPRLLY